MDWCVQFSGFLDMSAHDPYILSPCRIVRTGTRFFWGPANQRARQKTVQRKPLIDLAVLNNLGRCAMLTSCTLCCRLGYVA